MAYRRRKANGRFYIFLLVAAAAALAVFLVVRLSTGGTVEHGSIPLSKTASTVIVRDERIATVETYGNIKFLSTEGERVESGAKVAEVYKAGYNENIIKDLLTLQQEIRKYQVETILKDIVDSELSAVDTSINAQVDKIASAVRQENTGDVLLLERELERQMSDRRDLLRTKVQPDDKLNELYEKEKTLLESIDALKGDALAVSSGLISFYFDGYEDLLSVAKLADISVSDVTSALKGTGKPQNAETQRKLYRIVNSSRWYCVLVEPKSELQRLVLGEQYSVVFEGYFDRPYSAKLVGAKETDDGMVYTLEIDEDIGPFLSARKSKATIVRTFDGLRVPTRTLATLDSKTGVYVRAGGSKQFIEVDVLARSRDYAIVRAKDASAPLAEGMRVTAN